MCVRVGTAVPASSGFRDAPGDRLERERTFPASTYLSPILLSSTPSRMGERYVHVGKVRSRWAGSTRRDASPPRRGRRERPRTDRDDIRGCSPPPRRTHESGRTTAGRPCRGLRMPGWWLLHIRARSASAQTPESCGRVVSAAARIRLPCAQTPLSAHGSPTTTHDDRRENLQFCRKHALAPHGPRSPMCNTGEGRLASTLLYGHAAISSRNTTDLGDVGRAGGRRLRHRG